MSKQVTRTCDLCAEVETADSDQSLVSAGWTELRYTFGSTINAYNAVMISKDVCPACAIKMGMICHKQRHDESTYMERPSKENIKTEIEPTLEDHLREFIVNIGNEEGWYKNE